MRARAATLDARAAALAAAPDPEAARRQLLRLSSGPDRAGDALACAAPDRMAVLAHLLSLGGYAADTLARDPQALAELLAGDAPWAPSPADLHAELDGWRARGLTPIDALREQGRRWKLRIAARDVGGLAPSAEVSENLRRVADHAVRACLAAGDAAGHDGLVVFALGKLGGGEPNFSSDVDLVFATTGDVATAGQAAAALCRALAERGDAGFLFRVDCRLRPWGAAGPLVATLEGWGDYLSRRADPWERQAMLRARPVAGDLEAGAAFLRAVRPTLLRGGDAARRHVRAMKDRIEARLVRGRRDDVKLSPGGLRDVEFLVQALQMESGAVHPEVVTGHTGLGLSSLHRAGLLDPADAAVLCDSYALLRTVENRLMLADDLQVHRLPSDVAARRVLGRSLGLAAPGEDGAEALGRTMDGAMGRVREIFDRLMPAGGAPGA